MAALSVLRGLVQLKLRDTGTRVLSSANVTSLLNEALNEWVTYTEELRQENAYAVTANQFDYAAPTDMIRLLQAWYGPTYIPIEVVSHHELMDTGGYRLTDTGTPLKIIVEGPNAAQRFRLWPAPSATSATTTLNDSGGINSSDTSVILTSASSFRTPAGWISIESEKILYQLITSNTMSLLRRAMGQTTAASHADGTTATQLDLHVVYSRLPTALSGDSDVPEIDIRFHTRLVTYVLAQALRLDGRLDQAMALDAEWAKNLTEGRRLVRKIQGAAPSMIRTYY